MKVIRRLRIRAERGLIIFLSISLYVFLFTLDNIYTFQTHTAHSMVTWFMWLRFGFSAFVAFTFLAIGSFVFLFTRNRRVAWLLLCFSVAMMTTFIVETASVTGDSILVGIAGVSSSIAFTSLACLLLLFPRNLLDRLLSDSSGTAPGKSHSFLPLVYRVYVAVLIVLCAVTALNALVEGWFSLHVLWLTLGTDAYDLLVLVGILVTIGISYRLNTTLRQRQQQRIFAFGIILSFAPLLLFTFLPYLLNLPHLVVSSQLSTITIGFLPLALGYTILRYQVLVFDRYVRHAVAWMTGIVGLFAVGYVILILINIFQSTAITSGVIISVVLMGALGPCIWWGGRVITERLFFTEMRHYRRLIDSADILSGEGFDIEQASQLLTMAALQAFQTQEICLFVLDDESGTFRLYPSLSEVQDEDRSRRALAERLFRLATPLHPISQESTWIREDEPFIQQLVEDKHPSLLHLLTRTEPQRRLSLSRFVVMSGPLDYTDPLLAPIQASGKVIGILVLGERSDHQQYAGPDLDAAQYLAARFSPTLETARLYARSRRNARILSTLYSENVLSVQRFETVDDVARAYTRVAADAVNAGAEIWLYSPRTHELQYVAHEGNGPALSKETVLVPSSSEDRVSWFYSGDQTNVDQRSSRGLPPCLGEASIYPLAWLPLQEGEQPQGVLMLTYPRPHFFTQEEQHVLEMFAHQCAVAIENVRITIALRQAYERQKELERLKDQFITTASHELRTPLTAVQGYIELLADFGESLDAASQAEFLEKARHSCDELSLMVSNIMDASLIETEVEHVKRSAVSVADAVRSVLEILEGNFSREQRTVAVQVPDELYVLADSVRLRQILLNILNNALKFSEPGSSIAIAAFEEGEQVKITIRDYGLGVPLSEQDRLFERFMRLERDMNSPVRGAGLGLYICKRLVEAMCGRLWVESSGNAGEGSTFALSLEQTRFARPTVTPQRERQQV